MAKVIVLTITLTLSIGAHAHTDAIRRPLQDIHNQLLSLYTPVVETAAQERLVNHFGDVPFTGDCDDYYMAAFNQLQVWGYAPHARFLRRKDNGELHLIACTEIDGRARCLDPNEKRIQRPRDIRREYRTVEVRGPF